MTIVQNDPRVKMAMASAKPTLKARLTPGISYHAHYLDSAGRYRSSEIVNYTRPISIVVPPLLVFHLELGSEMSTKNTLRLYISI